jgi:hypothetical protein
MILPVLSFLMEVSQFLAVLSKAQESTMLSTSRWKVTNFMAPYYNQLTKNCVLKFVHQCLAALLMVNYGFLEAKMRIITN